MFSVYGLNALPVGIAILEILESRVFLNSVRGGLLLEYSWSFFVTTETQIDHDFAAQT
jgi:hypothetical protein